jgi:hypothetical protein
MPDMDVYFMPVGNLGAKSGGNVVLPLRLFTPKYLLLT